MSAHLALMLAILVPAVFLVIAVVNSYRQGKQP